MADERSEIEIQEARREKVWTERIASTVPEHKNTGECGEPGCGKPLRSLEEAIAHFDEFHRLNVDIRWSS